MKEHILSKFSTVKPYNGQSIGYYDEKTQINYTTESCSEKLTDLMAMNSTKLTETIENSDPDEFCIECSSTETAEVENSDPDEFVCKSQTTVTFTVENSDPDEFCIDRNTVETRTLENSDADEFMC